MDSKSINSQLILGNVQAQVIAHVANVQIGLGHRQLPSELDLPFSYKLFTDTDGESGHSW